MTAPTSLQRLISTHGRRSAECEPRCRRRCRSGFPASGIAAAASLDIAQRVWRRAGCPQRRRDSGAARNAASPDSPATDRSRKTQSLAPGRGSLRWAFAAGTPAQQHRPRCGHWMSAARCCSRYRYSQCSLLKRVFPLQKMAQEEGHLTEVDLQKHRSSVLSFRGSKSSNKIKNGKQRVPKNDLRKNCKQVVCTKKPRKACVYFLLRTGVPSIRNDGRFSTPLPTAAADAATTTCGEAPKMRL